MRGARDTHLAYLKTSGYLALSQPGSYKRLNGSMIHFVASRIFNHANRISRQQMRRNNPKTVLIHSPETIEVSVSVCRMVLVKLPLRRTPLGYADIEVIPPRTGAFNLDLSCCLNLNPKVSRQKISAIVYCWK